MVHDDKQSKSSVKNDLKAQRKWSGEIIAAEKRIKKWQIKSEKIVRRYLAQRAENSVESIGGDTRLNLFYANVKTLNSMLYGSLPKVDVSRRFADSSDDIARVAAETMERLLNSDLAVNGKEYDTVLRSTLQDRLLGGLGVARVRYSVKTEGEGAQERLVNESAPIDYLYWGDILWGWGRSFADVPWIAFRNYLTKREAEERFGKDKARDLTYETRTVSITSSDVENKDQESKGEKCEIWEIWNIKNRKVYWFSKGVEQILDSQPDRLKLTGFFPCPPFFLANPTTSEYIPTPDFMLCQDLYNEVDILQTRISILTTAVKAVGVYDASATGVERMFQEGTDNILIPVDTWAAFAEKGGLQGSVQWIPIGDIVAALDKLITVRDQTIALLQEISGMSDIMKGSLKNQYEGVGQTSMKAKFGSVRVQALQDEFAQFASDLMQLKAEVIARHFSPETIAKQSNMQKSLDAELLPQAIQLIKNPEEARLSVVIRPESVAMVDYSELKRERMDFLNAISMFLQSAAPLIESKPEAEPFMLKMLQWGLAGFKGSQEIEGVMDKAIEGAIQQLKQEQGKPKPDPAADAQKAKQEGEIAKIKAKAEADGQTRQADLQADMQTIQAQLQADMQKIQAEAQADISEIQAKMQAEQQKQQGDAQANAMQHKATTDQEVEKIAVSAQIDLEKLSAKAQLDILVDEAKAANKVKGNGEDNASS